MIHKVALPSLETRSATSFEENASRGIPLVRGALLRSDIHGQTADIILSSWRPSTAKQYRSYIQKWLHFFQIQDKLIHLTHL